MSRHNVTVEDSSPLVVYTNYSQWQDSPNNDPDYSKYSGPSQTFNSFHQTTLAASLGFPFNGTGIYVFGSKGPKHGAFNVTLTPNNTQPSFGAFSGPQTEVTPGSGFNGGGAIFQQLLFSRTDLDRSVPHYINITNSGQGLFILDYFIVETELGHPNSSVNEITVDDSHPAFTYPVGSWDSDLSHLNSTPEGRDFLQLLNGQTEHHTSAVDAQVGLNFRGSGIAVHGVWFSGSFFARIDNRTAVPVKSSNSGFEPGSYNRPRELIFTEDGLKEGMHTLIMTNSDSSISGGLSIDYAVISTTDPKNLDGVTPPGSTDSKSKDVQDPNSGHSTDLGPIIGGAIGGFVLLALVVVVLWLLRRRRQRRMRAQVDLLDEADTESLRRANSWVPWQHESTNVKESTSQLQGAAAMSSVAELTSETSLNASATALVTSQNTSSVSPWVGNIIDPTRVSERPDDTAPVTALTTSPSRRTGKRRREPETASQPAPRHAADAGVTLLRAGTVTSVRTLPPLYDDQWGRDRSVDV